LTLLDESQAPQALNDDDYIDKVREQLRANEDQDTLMARQKLTAMRLKKKQKLRRRQCDDEKEETGVILGGADDGDEEVDEEAPVVQ
jgi:hypothetical protein